MKKILFAILSTISISAFAGQPAMDGTALVETGKAHMISDASTGGGGEDRRREVLAIQVTDASGPVAGAKCTLTNDKGDWSTTAPDTVKVLRSAGDLTIVCSKEGYNAHTLVVSAGSTQIQPEHFRFQADSDDASDDPITVPYYNATITMSLTAAVAPQASN
jgi:hypothetical protein